MDNSYASLKKYRTNILQDKSDSYTIIRGMAMQVFLSEDKVV